MKMKISQQVGEKSLEQTVDWPVVPRVGDRVGLFRSRGGFGSGPETDMIGTVAYVELSDNGEGVELNIYLHKPVT